MPKLDKFGDLFDTKPEIIGWIFLVVLLVSVFGRFELSWTQITLAITTATLFLGPGFFAGMEIGPTGFRVGDKCELD